jgi:hypothetical protein
VEDDAEAMVVLAWLRLTVSDNDDCSCLIVRILALYSEARLLNTLLISFPYHVNHLYSELPWTFSTLCVSFDTLHNGRFCATQLCP